MPLITKSMEKKMSEKICSLCSFYDSSQDDAGENDERSGYCRFNAPKIFDNKKSAFWPLVKATDWCGKFLEIK